MKEAEKPWEEALDLDDSDLSCLEPLKSQKQEEKQKQKQFLQRCCSSLLSQSHILPNPPSQFHPPSPPASSLSAVTRRRIPGPAATVQAAMHRRKNFTEFGGELIPTQDYIRRAVEHGVGPLHDDDFSHDPWISAVRLIQKEGLVDSDGAIGIPLSAIKSGFCVDKVVQVTAIIESCIPNGLGDAMVTLKDPTGTIDASIHRRVLSESEFGKEISVGAVIILQKVAVFTPCRSIFYLNITLSNVVKVISKDGKAPKHSCSALTVTHATLGFENSKKSKMPQMPIPLSQGRTEEIMNSLRKNSRNGQTEGEVARKTCCNGNGSSRSQTVVSGKEDLSVGQDAPSKTTVGRSSDNNDEVLVCELLNPLNQASGGTMLPGAPYATATPDLVGIPNNQGMGHNSMDRWLSTSKASLPQWTDEQLDELFA